MIKLSIIVPTLGRKKEVRELLGSIVETIPQNLICEILIIDQNFSELLDDVIEEFKYLLNIKHYKVSFRGLSRAKNFGISEATGEILCFPDDDCRFLPDMIQKAMKLLSENDFDMISGKTIDEKGNDSIVVYKTKSSTLQRNDFEGKFTEAAIFTYKSVIEKYLFDVDFGVGAFYGAGEGWDLILRMFKDKKKIYYDADLIFYHPQGIVDKTDASSIKRAFSYSCGFAAVCIKHKLYFRVLSRLLLLIAYVPFCFVFNHRHFRYFSAQLLGLQSGIIVK